MPAGRMPSVTSWPTMASMQRCTIPSPPQTSTQLGPLVDRLADALRRLLALRDLEPDGILDAGARPAGGAARGARRRATFCWWATTATGAPISPSPRGGPARTRCLGWLPRGPPARATGAEAACAARTATRATTSTATPISAPAKTSVGWCMPRYTRAKPTATGMTTTAAHARARQTSTGGARRHHDGHQQVDHHGGRGVTGRKARRRRLGAELRDVGPRTTDDVVDGEEHEQLQRQTDDQRRDGLPPSTDGEDDRHHEGDRDGADRVGRQRERASSGRRGRRSGGRRASSSRRSSQRPIGPDSSSVGEQEPERDHQRGDHDVPAHRHGRRRLASDG